MLVHTANELEQAAQAGPLGPPHGASFSEPSRDRIFLAMDLPADRWYGLIAHEVTHLFTFDIIPGAGTPRWIMEGPGGVQTRRVGSGRSGHPSRRGSRKRDPENERAFRIWRQHGPASARWLRSRRVRLHRVAVGQAGRAAVPLRPSPDRRLTGAIRTRAAFGSGETSSIGPSNSTSREKFAGSAGQIPAERFDYRATVRIEGNVIAIHSSVPIGLACIEVWAVAEGGIDDDGPWSVATRPSRMSCGR